ncbi:hypothetical protein UB34_12065 [Photobacterium leiognathi]|uniref:Uncharacterized protein n=1 Tax=Photobacterium leiognathi TaxID=553611 RepID=A0A2T3MGF0_PHOLE|nr:hypothetical protein UB34_12065 [Photobacterium leiognathi]PSV93247.1 hypothetical protein CTM89_02190 [Photobacterium leiognathi]
MVVSFTCNNQQWQRLDSIFSAELRKIDEVICSKRSNFMQVEIVKSLSTRKWLSVDRLLIVNVVKVF